MNREEVFEAISKERDNQIEKWGTDRKLSLPGFLLVLEEELNEAKYGWMKNLPGKSAPLNELVQVAAVAVACLEKYGITGTSKPVKDEMSINQVNHPMTGGL
jgi:hypothetical protein